MNDADLAVHVIDRLWFLAHQDGIDVSEYKSRAEELLFCYAQMQTLHITCAKPDFNSIDKLPKPSAEGEK